MGHIYFTRKGRSSGRLGRYSWRSAGSILVVPVAVARSSSEAPSRAWDLPAPTLPVTTTAGPLETLPHGAVTQPGPIPGAPPVTQAKPQPNSSDSCVAHDVHDFSKNDPEQDPCSVPEVPRKQFAHQGKRGRVPHRLVATALACNVTRVYTYLWSGGRELHGAYADTITLLRDTPVGDNKSALDQTLRYGVTEVSEPNGHVMANYHIVLAGHAGGKMPGNRHLRFPGSRKVTELQLTMMQMMGLEIDNFGSWDNTSKTVPEIMG